MLDRNNFEKSGPRKVQYVGAGGNQLELEDYVVDMIVDVEGFGKIRLRNVIVAKTEKVNKVMLIGRHDMTRLGVTVDFRSKKVSLGVGHLANRKFDMKKRLVRESIEQLEMNPWGSFHIRTIAEDNLFSCPIEVKPESNSYQICEIENNPICEIEQKSCPGAETKSPESEKEITQWMSREDKDGVQQGHTVEEREDVVAHRGDPCNLQICESLENTPTCAGCELCVNKEVQEILKRNEKAPQVEENEHA